METRAIVSSWRPLLLAVGVCVAWSAASAAQTPAVVVPAPDVLTPVPDTPHSKLIQSVSLSPIVAFAGADLRVVVRVQPEAGNRRLQLSVDAPTFYASTERQLDGVDGARAHTFSVKQLPAGDYQIVATLEGNDGVRSRVTRSFKVMGEDDTQVQQDVRPPTGRRRGRSN